MDTIKPFDGESELVRIGEPTIENRTDRTVLYGNLDLSRDKAGPGDAWALKALVDRVVKALEAEKDLPDKVAPPEKPATVANSCR